MHKCIIVREGEVKRNEKERKYGGIYKFCWNRGEICNVHHWFRGMNDIGRLWLRLMWSSKGAVSLFGMFMLDWVYWHKTETHGKWLWKMHWTPMCSVPMNHDDDDWQQRQSGLKSGGSWTQVKKFRFSRKIFEKFRFFQAISSSVAR